VTGGAPPSLRSSLHGAGHDEVTILILPGRYQCTGAVTRRRDEKEDGGGDGPGGGLESHCNRPETGTETNGWGSYPLSPHR
jgi:hypothetical protein